MKDHLQCFVPYYFVYTVALRNYLTLRLQLFAVYPQFFGGLFFCFFVVDHATHKGLTTVNRVFNYCFNPLTLNAPPCALL